MKSSTRNLIIVGGVIVVLGGAMAALTLTGGEEEAVSSVVDNSVTLVSKQLEDIVSMRVENEHGGYTIIPTVQKVESTASGESSATVTEKTVCTIEELGDLPQYNSGVERVLQDGFSLIASKNVGVVSDLEEYGLENPTATVEVKFKDGGTFAYNLGSVSASDSGSYYMCPKDSDNVYLVSVDDRIFENGAEDFVVRKLTALTGSTGQETPEFGKITLSGANFPQPLEIERDAGDSILYLTEGGDSSTRVRVDDTKYSNITGVISALTADEVVYAFPTAEELQKCGLDTPAATIEFVANEETYKLSAGGSDGNGNRYLMMDGLDVIFATAAEDVTPWADTSAYDLRSKFVHLPNIVDVGELTISISDGTEYKFVQTRTKDEEESTEDTPVYDYEVTCNGKPITYDPNYKKFYTNVIAVQILEQVGDQQPQGEPYVTVTYDYYDSSRSNDVVKFYLAADRRYLAEVNGRIDGLVTEKNVESIIDSAEKMSRDELVVTII